MGVRRTSAPWDTARRDIDRSLVQHLVDCVLFRLVDAAIVIIIAVFFGSSVFPSEVSNRKG